jgi:dimethylargininase
MNRSDTFRTAILRTPGLDSGAGLTTAGLGPPDPELLLRQHEAYARALAEAGLDIVLLPAAPGFPDAYFVEDPAVVASAVAVITRPGAASRRGEEESLAPVLARFKPLARIEAPGTLEGGDVLEAGGRWFIGVSERTNEEGARQLGAILTSHGETWTAVPVPAGLHLKSSVNDLGDGRLIVTPDLEFAAAFRGFRRLVLEPEEGYAANVLRVNGRILLPAGFPAVRRKIAALGLAVRELDVSEVRKMDGGLTCMSLRF